MARFDVFKSLLRSTAMRAAARVGELDLGEGLRDVLQQLSLRRMVVDETRLTAAVGRLQGIDGATVSIGEAGIAVQVSDDAGRELSVTLRPRSVSFAPKGAKEITFVVDPPEAAAAPRCSEVFGAIADEIARTLWAAVLPQSDTGHVFVHRDGAALSADLRTAQGARQAASNPVSVAFIDALRLQAITLAPGRLHLQIGLEGLV